MFKILVSPFELWIVAFQHYQFCHFILSKNTNFTQRILTENCYWTSHWLDILSTLQITDLYLTLSQNRKLNIVSVMKILQLQKFQSRRRLNFVKQTKCKIWRYIAFAALQQKSVPVFKWNANERKTKGKEKKYQNSLTENFNTGKQSYEINLVLKKTNLVLNFLVVHYLNSNCNNTVVRSKLR